ncbi:hypothetical protein [Streptomyces sp900116325]
MSTQTTPDSAPDAAYRTLLGHTMGCARCRANAPCADATKLRRAWRETRR